MSRFSTTSQSLIVSLLVHALIVFVLGVFLITRTRAFRDLIDASILQPAEPPKPMIRKPMIKPAAKPVVPVQSITVADQIQPTPRVATSVSHEFSRVADEQPIEFTNRRLQLDLPPNPHTPRIVDPTQPTPRIVTHVNLPVSDSPGALAYAAAISPGGGNAKRFSQRGHRRVHPGVSIGRNQLRTASGITSLLDATDADPSALDALNREMLLGNQLMVPLQANELGARIYTDPYTGMPTGYFHICYVRFRQRGMNEFFRVDPTALYFLVRWMTQSTHIKGRIAGRTLFLDDPGIHESPMLYMNGTKAAHLRPTEKRNLRRYLVEKGGFIFVDDDMGEGSASIRAFARSLRAQFREIILGAGGRELMKIPNDHPIWNEPFKLGGQPASPNPYSRPTLPMTAFELNGRLSVVISYDDYNNGWEAPGRGMGGVDFVPSILRMGANFMFYAGTHGKISDYKHYIPPDKWRNDDALEPVPKRAPQAASITAVDRNNNAFK